MPRGRTATKLLWGAAVTHRAEGAELIVSTALQPLAYESCSSSFLPAPIRGGRAALMSKWSSVLLAFTSLDCSQIRTKRLKICISTPMQDAALLSFSLFTALDFSPFFHTFSIYCLKLKPECLSSSEFNRILIPQFTLCAIVASNEMVFQLRLNWHWRERKHAS